MRDELEQYLELNPGRWIGYQEIADALKIKKPKVSAAVKRLKKWRSDMRIKRDVGTRKNTLVRLR